MVLFQWQSEYEYLIHRICDLLDQCKQLGFLYVSTDYRNVNFSNPIFQNYVLIGSNSMREFLKDMLDKMTPFYTSGILSYLGACCIDDINLSHIFSLLRIHTLMEYYPESLNQHKLRASILTGIFGELVGTKNDLEIGKYNFKNTKQKINEIGFNRNNKDNNSNNNNNNDDTSDYEQCIELLKLTINQLCGLILDSGRDRSTYIKEVFCAPSFAPPKSDIFSISRNDEIDNQLSVQGMVNRISNVNKGDPLLVSALLCGSSLSIWQRIHLLYDPDREQSKDLIVYSVVYAAPLMDRMRQLVFTSFLQSLCRPQWCTNFLPQLSNKMKRFNNQYSEIVQLIVKGFILSGVTIWSYESQQQIHDISTCSSLTVREKELILKVFKLVDEHSLIQESYDESSIAPSFESVIRELSKEFYSNSNWDIEDTGFVNSLNERQSYNRLGNSIEGALKLAETDYEFIHRPLNIVSDRIKFQHAINHFQNNLSDPNQGLFEPKSDGFISDINSFDDIEANLLNIN
ncbi:hypothetical protein FG379_001156 [Cryptosporidium bovis]|uniref:uncharacterized protein n=1 Tax=Cryptosporidium bovis TaxID=310047 RepID=UPI00351A19FB|nr:hypothetical protein FG379_001156 [Cryptosporidium bovis]